MVAADSFHVDSGPEAQLVELPALRLLCGEAGHAKGAGWTYVHGPELSPDRPARERRLWSDVVLVERLRGNVSRLNPHLPAEAIDQATDLALTSTSPDTVEDHRGFHELLLAGVPVTYRDAEDVERHDHARLVDFDDPDNNEFLAVNQLTIIVGAKNRRPDILLFVNGLPLGEIECKPPGLDQPEQEAVNQVAHYRATIPPLYRYVEIVGVTDLMRAVVGTVTTPAEHFAEWKSMDEHERKRPQLELMVEGVFAPYSLLELVRDFVLFETDGARTQKVMAKYHQVHAVEAAVESVARAMQEGHRRGGLVWHTQGAGKSYTMVFFANRLRRDRRFANPTIVAVTDRTDLDNQLADSPQRTWGRAARRRRRSPAGRGASSSSSRCRPVASSSRRSRSSRRPGPVARCRCSASARTSW